MIDRRIVGVKLPDSGCGKGVPETVAVGVDVMVALGVPEGLAVGFIDGDAEGVETKAGPSEA